VCRQSYQVSVRYRQPSMSAFASPARKCIWKRARESRLTVAGLGSAYASRELDRQSFVGEESKQDSLDMLAAIDRRLARGIACPIL
jgi:hypothetical protein